MPRVLVHWFTDQSLESIDRNRFARLLADAWTDAEHPEGAVEAWVWVLWFDLVGFVTDCRRTVAPVGPQRLYRGCKPGGERAMSWTDDIRIARWFAGRFSAVLGPGTVVSCTAPPAAVMARFLHGRGENEWVLDPRWLNEDGEWPLGADLEIVETDVTEDPIADFSRTEAL
jgi:hypothetical protein